MASKKEIIADRRRKGAPKDQIKRGLDQPFIKGTAKSPFPPKPKETVSSVRGQLHSEQEKNWYLQRRMDGLVRENARLHVQLDAMVEQAVSRTANQAMAKDELLPF